MTQRLAEIIGNLGSGIGRTVQACEKLTLWNKIIDERVGKHTEAVKIRNRTLFILASNPTWAQELTFLKSEFIKKFNEAAGEEMISDIRFKAGG